MDDFCTAKSPASNEKKSPGPKISWMIFSQLASFTITFTFYALAHRNETIQLILLVSLQLVDSNDWKNGIHMFSLILIRNKS